MLRRLANNTFYEDVYPLKCSLYICVICPSLGLPEFGSQHNLTKSNKKEEDVNQLLKYISLKIQKINNFAIFSW